MLHIHGCSMKEAMLACGCQPEGSLTEFDINNTASLKGSFLPDELSEEGLNRSPSTGLDPNSGAASAHKDDIHTEREREREGGSGDE